MISLNIEVGIGTRGSLKVRVSRRLMCGLRPTRGAISVKVTTLLKETSSPHAGIETSSSAQIVSPG